MTKESILNLIKHNRAPIAAHAIHAILDKYERDKKTDESSLHLLRRELAIASKEVADLKERWRKTHEPSELRVQLARALEEIAILKRVNYNTGEIYSKSLSQKL